MKRFISLLIISLFPIALRAEIRCDIIFSKNQTCAELNWVYGPFLDQNNSARIRFSASTHFDNIKVIPWMVMSGHEHGSRPVKLTNLRNAEYAIENAYFMGGMMGDWYFRVQLLKNNTLLEESRSLIEFKP